MGQLLYYLWLFGLSVKEKDDYIWDNRLLMLVLPVSLYYAVAKDLINGSFA
jgi:hypothetical protein